MAHIRIPIEVRQFINAVKRRYAPARVIVFGSRARGTPHRWSDWDFLIISPRFKGEHPLDRGTRVRLLMKHAISIDVICLTPDEYADRKEGFGVVREAAREGVEVAA